MLAFLALSPITGCAYDSSKEPGVSQIDPEDREGRAEQFVAALVNGDYSIASAVFDADMQKAMNTAALKRTWEGVVAAAGAFKGFSGTEYSTYEAYEIYEVASAHEKQGVISRVVFDTDGQVAGLFFRFSE
jgi:hypothetical protein